MPLLASPPGQGAGRGRCQSWLSSPGAPHTPLSRMSLAPGAAQHGNYSLPRPVPGRDGCFPHDRMLSKAPHPALSRSQPAQPKRAQGKLPGEQARGAAGLRPPGQRCWKLSQRAQERAKGHQILLTVPSAHSSVWQSTREEPGHLCHHQGCCGCPPSQGCPRLRLLRQLRRLLLPPAAVRSTRRAGAERGPSPRARGERGRGARGSRTYRGGFAVHGPGSGLGWAQSRGSAMPAARCRAGPARLGPAREVFGERARTSVPAAQQTCRTCPAPAPPVSQELHNTCAVPAGQGALRAGQSRPQGTAASRGSPGSPEPPSTPLCPPLTHPPAALLPGPAQGRGCTAVPSQENLAAVSHKSGIPCPRGNERLFPSGSSRGL